MDPRIRPTINRAATAVVRSRLQVERAREEARLALEILTQMELPPDPGPGDPAERLYLMNELEDWVERLAALETEAPRWNGR